MAGCVWHWGCSVSLRWRAAPDRDGWKCRARAAPTRARRERERVGMALTVPQPAPLHPRWMERGGAQRTGPVPGKPGRRPFRLRAAGDLVERAVGEGEHEEVAVGAGLDVG